jgi:hypothetical protein
MSWRKGTNPELVTMILRALVEECKAAQVDCLRVDIIEVKLRSLEAERDTAIRRGLA